MNYTSQHSCDKAMFRQNGLISQMLSSELYKIMGNKLTFVGFTRSDRLNRPPGWGGPYRNADKQKEKLIRKPKFQI